MAAVAGCRFEVISSSLKQEAPKITLNYPREKEDVCRQIFRPVYYSLER